MASWRSGSFEMFCKLVLYVTCLLRCNFAESMLFPSSNQPQHSLGCRSQMNATRISGGARISHIPLGATRLSEERSSIRNSSATGRSIHRFFSWKRKGWGLRKPSEKSSVAAVTPQEAVGNRSKVELMEYYETESSEGTTENNMASLQSPVHLIQTEEGRVETDTASKDDSEDRKQHSSDKNATQTIQVHSYTDPSTRITYKALNTARSKFIAYLGYIGVSNVKMGDGNGVVTVQTKVTAAERATWRELWKESRLLTDRTELLAVYPSDDELAEDESDKLAPEGANSKKSKRGGFTDLLALYTDRLMSILKDEQDDIQSSNPNGLLEWLDRQYPESTLLRASNMSQMNAQQQLEAYQNFLHWFRENFPYYYDRCRHCGASMKEDADKNGVNESETTAAADEDEDDHQTFVGYVYPNRTELDGKASRTELYQCHVCQEFTRFPRFNAAWYVLEHKRGRCGEYSMLLFRLLRALGHDCRWVIDWADHVWAEVLLTSRGTASRWVHLDPCEAAVDNNLLYQEWGKKQTYILGFFAPPRQEMVKASMEDLTAAYTTDTWDEINQRRDMDQSAVKKAIDAAAVRLESRLADIMV